MEKLDINQFCSQIEKKFSVDNVVTIFNTNCVLQDSKDLISKYSKFFNLYYDGIDYLSLRTDKLLDMFTHVPSYMHDMIHDEINFNDEKIKTLNGMYEKFKENYIEGAEHTIKNRLESFSVEVINAIIDNLIPNYPFDKAKFETIYVETATLEINELFDIFMDSASFEKWIDILCEWCYYEYLEVLKYRK